MAAPSRKDKLRGLRGIVSSAFELALILEPTAPTKDRRSEVALAAITAVMGVGQMSGVKALQNGAAGAGLVVLTGQLGPELLRTRGRDVAAMAAWMGSDESLRATAALRARESPRERALKTTRTIVGSAFSFAMAADRSLVWQERVGSALLGGTFLAKEVAQRRGEEFSPAFIRAHGSATLASFGFAFVAGRRNRRRRR